MKHYTLGVITTLGIALMVIMMTVMAVAFATEPLYISGIDDLLSQGIVTRGAGTDDDPYVIEDLIITGSMGDYGLIVENIDAYVVISNCEVSNVMAAEAQGALVIRGCSNLTVRNCNIHHNEVGIRLSHCTNVSLLDNRITENRLGLRIDLLSRGNTIIGNYFDNDTNTWACCWNTWNDTSRGNFWSDLSGVPETGSGVYSISPGNEDHIPAGCDKWSDGERPPEPAPEGKEATAVKPRVEKDTIPPIIELEGQTELHLAAGECFTEPGWNATDDRDGDVSGSVACSGLVDTSRPGTYVLSYAVRDSSGNLATATRQVVVNDETPPIIALIGESEVKVPLGQGFNDPGAEATDNCDGDISAQITVEGISSLDVSKPGVYSIVYTAEDKAGNRASTKRRVIVGWPKPIKSGGVTGVLESLNTKVDAPTATVKLLYENGSAPGDLQLQIAPIVHTLAVRISHFTDAAVLDLSITDSGGKLAAIQIDLDDSAVNIGKISAPLCLFRSLKVLSFRDGYWLDFTQPPHTSEEAQQMVEAALDVPELSEFSMDVRATSITTLDGNVSFRIQLSDKLIANKDGFFTSLDRIRDASSTMQFLTALAIQGSWREIQVVLSADFYGLLYKNILASSAVLDEAIQQKELQASDMAQYWNEVFVHPVLATP